MGLSLGNISQYINILIYHNQSWFQVAMSRIIHKYSHVELTQIINIKYYLQEHCQYHMHFQIQLDVIPFFITIIGQERTQGIWRPLHCLSTIFYALLVPYHSLESCQGGIPSHYFPLHYYGGVILSLPAPLLRCDSPIDSRDCFQKAGFQRDELVQEEESSYRSCYLCC